MFSNLDKALNSPSAAGNIDAEIVLLGLLEVWLIVWPGLLEGWKLLRIIVDFLQPRVIVQWHLISYGGIVDLQPESRLPISQPVAI